MPILLILHIFLSLFFPKPVYADGPSCSVSVSPNSITESTTGQLDFNVSNTSGTDADWVEITPPSGFNIIGPAGGWQSGFDGSAIYFDQGTLSAGSSGTFSIDVSAADTSAPAQDFTVGITDTTDGSNLTTCLGDTSVAIGGPASVPPSFSNILVSNVTDSSVNVSWTTDEASTSEVDYDTTGDYTLSNKDPTLTTSHSINLNGLSANTTYFYQVISVNAAGDQASIAGNNFITALSGGTGVTQTATVTVTTNTTTTKVVTRILKDITPPVVSLTTSIARNYKTAPLFEGIATDAGNVNAGVADVEYSIDDGRDWLPVDSMTGTNSIKVTFGFTPNISYDGDYNIIVKAKDNSGNAAVSQIYKLVIDRLPPLMGGNIWSIGPIALLPDANGVITTLAGVDNKITMSAVGGPDSVELSAGKNTFSLKQSTDSGLWSGLVNFPSPGFYNITITSIDGAGNVTVQNLNSMLVISSGKVIDQVSKNTIPGANVNVYVLDPESNLWSLWDAASFGQSRETTDNNGGYSYFLPPGTYYLIVTAPGYKKVTSKIFTLASATALNSDFAMVKGWWVNPFDIADISVVAAKLSGVSSYSSSLIGTLTPEFILPTVSGQELDMDSLGGTSRDLIFLNTWLPDSAEQISELESLSQIYKNRVLLVVSEENLSEVTVFAKKGGYDNLTIVVDADGTLVTPYKVDSLPTNYFIDKNGVVQKVVTGVVTGNDIMNYLDNI